MRPEAAPPTACGIGARLVSNEFVTGSYSQTCDWALEDLTGPVSGYEQDRLFGRVIGRRHEAPDIRHVRSGRPSIGCDVVDAGDRVVRAVDAVLPAEDVDLVRRREIDRGGHDRGCGHWRHGRPRVRRRGRIGTACRASDSCSTSSLPRRRHTCRPMPPHPRRDRWASGRASASSPRTAPRGPLRRPRGRSAHRCKQAQRYCERNEPPHAAGSTTVLRVLLPRF